MSELERWLARRRPPPPPPVAEWIEEALDAEQDLSALASAGLEALGRAAERPGRVRASAFTLLGADALLTYACEAALESPDPEGELRALLRAAAAGRP